MMLAFVVALIAGATVSVLSQLAVRRYPRLVIRVCAAAVILGALSFAWTRDHDSTWGRATSRGVPIGLVAASFVGVFFPTQRR